MPVRIGKIELVGLTNIATEDSRNLVQHRVPGQSGSVFQDLGREPITIVMQGILLGEDPQGALEQLRQAQMKATPLSFAADAIAGADLTDVLIADFQVRQLAGHARRFSFFLRVKEYLEPPVNKRAGLVAVDAAVSADATSWSQGSTAAAGVLRDPGSLMEAVGQNPDLLQHLSPDELGSVVTRAQDALSGEDFGDLLGSLGEANPSAVGGFLGALREKGSLGSFVQKLVSGGVNLLERVKGINFGAAFKFIKALAGAGDFLSRLQRVAREARALGEALLQFDPVAAVQQPESEEESITTVDIVERATALSTAIHELLGSQFVEDLVELVRDMGIGARVKEGLQVLVRAVERIGTWVGKLEQVLLLPRLLEALAPAFEGLEALAGTGGEELRELGLDTLAPVADAARGVLGLLERMRRGVLRVLGGLLPEAMEAALARLRESLGEIAATLRAFQEQLEPKRLEATA